MQQAQERWLWDDFNLGWTYAQGDTDYSDAAQRVLESEAEAARVLAERDARRRTAIRRMRAAGLSLRDAADLIGISHQRVSQIEREQQAS